MKYILALDQGTTSCRAVLFNEKGEFVQMSQKEFTQIYPKAGWVEHNPIEILNSQVHVMKEVVTLAKINPKDIASIGISNQRETTVVWDKHSGDPLCNAIVWQDRRTASICDDLKSRKGVKEYIRENTGLVIDAYFSATKLKWILDKYDPQRTKSNSGDYLFGTIDTWLIWNLTGGWVHATDYSNASRTMIYNIKQLDWDQYILDELDIPRAMLPEVVQSSGIVDKLDKKYFGVEIPIAGVAGDQQASLFGQACTEAGMAKNTYGTGCFVLYNTGDKPFSSNGGLITTIAWGIDGKIEYALEGGIFNAGSAIQWLRDEMKLIDESSDTEYYANKVQDSGGIYVVPAFTGLGAPYWDMYARGAIFGLTRSIKKAHIIRATLESIAYRTKDVLEAMEKETGLKVKQLRVDGGASVNNFLMQFQSDILGVNVLRSNNTETTARGAAYLAGIGIGLWTKENLEEMWKADREFTSTMSATKKYNLYKGWQKAIKRTFDWEEK